MLNLLWWVPLIAGFHDGINPCVLITASYSLLTLEWFKTTGFSKKWLILFYLPLIGTTFLINCGLLDKIIITQQYVQITKYVYVLLALILAFCAIKFIIQWFYLVKGYEVKKESVVFQKPTIFSLSLILILSSIVLSFMAGLWPLNYYVSVLSIYFSVPGQLLVISTLIFTYTLISYWIVFFIFWFELISNKNLRLFKIVSAAIMLSASIGVIDLFL